MLCLFLYLLTVDPGAASREDCKDTKPIINLSSSKSNVHDYLNEKLEEICGNFYDFNVLPFCSTTKCFLQATNRFSKVVNLFVDDYYESAVKDSNDIVYAGDVFNTMPVGQMNADNCIICPRLFHTVREHSYEKVMKCNHEKTLKQLPKGVEHQIAKVVSKSVAELNSGDLLNFISSIQYNKTNIISRGSCREQASMTTDLDIILICSDECIKSHSTDYDSANIVILFKPIKKCSNYMRIFQNNILAVLAPKPFKTDYEISIPIIFYETIYLNSDDQSLFVNSINLMSGLLLKYAFMKIINDANWKRVAIISDNSYNSKEFEEEILKMFHEKQIIYNAQTFENEKGLQQAISYLSQVDARIVIANVEEENAKKLVKKQIGQFTVIYRVPPFPPLQDHSNWISITLDAMEQRNDRINQVLRIIAKEHAISERAPKELHRATFYRNFSQKIMSMIRPQATANVSSKKYPQASKLQINENGDVTYHNPNNPPKIGIIYDQSECLSRVNDFAKPCNNFLYLYMMLVIMVFAITFLTITCYFNETSPLMSSRYQQF